LTLDLITGHRFAALTDGEGNFNIKRSNIKRGKVGWACEFTTIQMLLVLDFQSGYGFWLPLPRKEVSQP